MIAPKFKTGDKVVVVESDWEIPVGTVLEICGYDPKYNFWLTLPTQGEDLSAENADPWTEGELELERVHNSPLYKALR